jgi:hypothetical protein
MTERQTIRRHALVYAGCMFGIAAFAQVARPVGNWAWWIIPVLFLVAARCLWVVRRALTHQLYCEPEPSCPRCGLEYCPDHDALPTTETLDIEEDGQP